MLTVENTNMLVKTKYIAIVLLLVWILSMVYMTFTVNNSSGGGWGSTLSSDQNNILKRALAELERVKEDNARLSEHVRNMARERRNEGGIEESHGGRLEIVRAVEPSKEHEVLLRRVSADVRESWFFIRDQLNSIKMAANSNPDSLGKKIDEVVGDMFEYYSVTSNDLDLLASANGTDEWRLGESRELSNVVRGVLEMTQNPSNCSQSRLLLCNLGKGCGFGCQVHHLVFCLITSVATNRTLVVDSKVWRYLDNGWNKFFIPPSRTCDASHTSGAVQWSVNHEKNRVVLLPIIDVITPRPDFLPLAVPRQISERLTRLHGDPFAWWAGQMVGYLLRPQPYLSEVIKENKEKLRFMSGRGVVGVHIRRTDKVAAEAAFHKLDEYMTHVERYFDRVDLGRSEPSNRAIYMASDDPNVFTEAATKYPDYIVYGNKEFSETASLSSRYSEVSLRSVILDVYFLSTCDHLVCTFSSQVCRLAYELMQTMHGDASNRFTSLDDIYYFGGQLGHTQVARLDHKARDNAQLDLQKGDHIKVAGNHWNGYSMGNSASKRGLYPSFKVLEKLDLADFPVFDDYFSNAISNRSVAPFPSDDLKFDGPRVAETPGPERRQRIPSGSPVAGGDEGRRSSRS